MSPPLHLSPSLLLWAENGTSIIQNVMKVPGGVKIEWKKLEKASYYKIFRRAVGTNKWVWILAAASLPSSL